MEEQTLKDLVAALTAGMSVIVAGWAIAAAFRSGVLRRITFGPLEIEAGQREAIRGGVEEALRSREPTPFEIEQLANYYSQVLNQSKISFWFSLVFASLGFAVIVAAAFLHTTTTGTATLAQFTAGLIMDAVAALFFIQSRSAQESMSEFFDKLRTDRMQTESRNLVNQISSDHVKDALLLQLSLYYAGIPNSHDVAAKLSAHSEARPRGNLQEVVQPPQDDR